MKDDVLVTFWYDGCVVKWLVAALSTFVLSKFTAIIFCARGETATTRCVAVEHSTTQRAHGESAERSTVLTQKSHQNNDNHKARSFIRLSRANRQHKIRLQIRLPDREISPPHRHPRNSLLRLEICNFAARRFDQSVRKVRAAFPFLSFVPSLPCQVPLNYALKEKQRH